MRPGRGEEDNRLGDVSCRAEPPQWGVVAGHRQRVLVELAGADQPCGHAVGEHARPDAVGSDAEAALLDGQARTIASTAA